MPYSIICTTKSKKSDLSITGIENPDLFEEDFDEPCFLAHDDTFFFVDDDDPDDDLRPDRKLGTGLRWSESRPFEFWTYYDRFVRYWPKKRFHVKYAYQTGFMEKKRKGSDQPIPLFESYAVELTERHLDADSWADWKGRKGRTDPIWLGLHIPKLTTVDAIDVDAKKYLLGYYQDGSSSNSPMKPVVHLPLEHFKLLKRIYDQFPRRIWCISSETLGVHVWKKHDRLQLSEIVHQKNKAALSRIGLGSIESHPMPGRCFRRPFGADYRTITPDGILTHWIDQVNYFENDGRTPDFPTICWELLNAVSLQWKTSVRCGPNKSPVLKIDELEQELHEVQQWLKAGCTLEPLVPVPEKVNPTTAICRDILAATLNEQPAETTPPIQRMCQAILLVTFGEKTTEDIQPILQEASAELNQQESDCRHTVRKTGTGRHDLTSMRNGNWPKELLRLARTGLEHEDSVATVVHEMAKWLWWIELFHLPESTRTAEIISLLTAFVLKKHNNCVTRLSNGHEQDLIAQIVRCVELASKIADAKSVNGFAETREKWLNGGYKYPIRIVPALTGSFDGLSNKDTVSQVEDKEDVSLSSSCPFVMCINFGVPLPNQVQERIKAQAGRNKILPFATKLLNRLYSNNGSEYLGRPILLQLLGYNNPNQIAKYLKILEKTGVIKRGSSYSTGRNGKLITLQPSVIQEMEKAQLEVPMEVRNGLADKVNNVSTSSTLCQEVMSFAKHVDSGISMRSWECCSTKDEARVSRVIDCEQIPFIRKNLTE